jgi:hypothetical protein
MAARKAVWPWHGCFVFAAVKAAAAADAVVGTYSAWHEKAKKSDFWNEFFAKTI